MTPVDVSGLTSGVKVSAGNGHTCALLASGGMQCWGDNGNGQLGDDTTTQRLIPTNVLGLESGVVDIAASGSAQACALTVGGGVKCWGYNNSGQLGDGTTTQRNTPVDVSGLTSGVVAISAGTSHACALTSAGSVKCWGSNYNGQLGDGTTSTRLTPVDVDSLTSDVLAIDAGVGYTCSFRSSGGVWCWGFNSSGQLGDGSTTTRLTPVDAATLAAFHFDSSGMYVSNAVDKAYLSLVADYNESNANLKVNYSSTTGASGTVYFPAGSTQQTVSLALPANLTIGQIINVSLSKASTSTAVISPSTIALTVAADRIAFDVSNVNVDELAGTVTLTVQRTGQNDFGAASIEYATQNGTANAGSDYSASSGTLSWGAGDLGAKTISIPILHNPASGSDSVFYVVLSNPSATKINGTATATVTIRQADDAYWNGGGLASDWTKPTWASTGWMTASDYAYGGMYSLKSQPTPHSGTAVVEISGNYLAGTVSFARKVSSEASFDYLRFYIDGVKMGEWSGEQTWQVVSYPVSAGSHTFRWSYEKDAADSVGLDAAWIDAVSLPPIVITTPGAPTLIQLFTGNGRIRVAFNPPASNGGSAIISYTATCTAGTSSHVATGASSPLTVTGLTNGVTYTCSVTATNNAGTSAASVPASLIVKPLSIAPIINILLD